MTARSSGAKTAKIVILASHAVQYQTPIYRALARRPDVELEVRFLDGLSGQGGFDKQFGVNVKWDTDQLSGYRSEVLPKERVARARALVDVLRAARPDAFISFMGVMSEPALSAIAVAKTMRIPVFARFEGNEESRQWRAIDRRREAVRAVALRGIYSAVDGFLSIGRLNDEHLAKFGVPTQKIWRAPYNTDDEHFVRARDELRPKRDELRRQFGIEPDEFVFLYSGKFYDVKAPLTILDAIEDIKERSKLRLLCAGSGELFEEFKNRAERILGAKAILPGFVNQSELPKYYAAADALMLVSKAETWGVVVNEAMLFGLPVIVSDRVGSRHDLVAGRGTGLIFAHDKPLTLARAMEEFLANPLRAKEMGVTARKTVEAGYLASHVADAVVRAVDDVSRRPSARSDQS